MHILIIKRAEMIEQKSEKNERSERNNYCQEAHRVLTETLQFSGLSIPLEVNYRSVAIYEKESMHQIYTINEKEGLDHLVLLHGFGGTAMTFCRVLRYLRPHYHVHALDTFGVGHSSQGSFTHQLSHQQVVDYYIDAMEQWRIQRGIKNFTLVGHSFGGYLAALYCEKYGERVNRLVLLSPAGIIRKSDEEIRRELDEWRNTGCGTRLLVFFMEIVYKWNVRPSKAMNSYLVGSRLIDRIVDGHFDLKEEESAAWKKYFRHLAGRDNMGEFGFYHLFQWPLKPKKDISSILHSLQHKFRVEFYFGQFDWMDQQGAHQLAMHLDHVQVDFIENAGHQLIFDNPQDVSRKIIFKHKKKKYYP